ncbi:hypothetical protein ACLB2K_066316 [Fragaria x ananassa]
MVEGLEVEDSEAMYGLNSNEEVIGYELNSDDDGEGHQWPEFNPKTDMKNPRFCNGMLFATPRILRAAIRERAIQKGWVPLWDMNDKCRLRAICQAENCNYELYASKMQHEDTFQIKRIKEMKKRAAEKALAKAAGKGPPTRGRPPKATTSIVRNASANAQPSQPSQASSRSTEENRG